MSEDQPHVPINPQEQQITPDIPQDGQYDVVRTGGDVESGWSLDHSKYNPKNGDIVAYKPQYDEQGRFLGVIDKTVKREVIIAFNSPENKELRRQEQLQTEIGESAVQHEVDAPYAKRLEKLFAPVKIEESQISYDSLLDPNNDLQSLPIEGAAKRSKNERGSISEESLETAKNEYMGPLLQGDKDPKIAEIIKLHAKTETMSPDDAMQLLREDSSLRKEVGAYLLAKLEANTAILPERVARNNQKKANKAGYESIPSMSSHEYVALLAIAKLDGSFNYEQDPIQNDESGNVLLGQHRVAADMMLKGY